MSKDMVKYYRDRAKEYEKVYKWRDPCRQKEQDRMEDELVTIFKGLKVLDIGCGTGFWTQRISKSAKSIVGIDINETVLEIARSKNYLCPIDFRVMDAYNMRFEEKFTGALATFMISHVSKQDILGWLIHIHTVLEPGALVFFADNNYIEGIGGKLVTKPKDPNTYKLRTLNNGSQHLIIKNYFTADELLSLFRNFNKKINKRNIFMGNCFWWIKYKLNE
jgi:ubiquinone/menaquinone biosynthesis C-methylase UbiE